MNYFWAFVTGGAICVVGQLFLDLTALTPARILTGYVVAGVVLSALGWYAPLAEFAGCGATVPLLGFGHLLAKGVRTALAEEGAIGILTGGLTAAAAGITTSLVCGVVCSLVGRSHGANRRSKGRCPKNVYRPRRVLLQFWSCLRRGLFTGGPQPRPELKQDPFWDDTRFSCIVLFCADSRPLYGILFQKRR